MIAKAFYILDILILKLSLLFQILRVFAPTRGGTFWGTTGLMVTNTVFYIIELTCAKVALELRRMQVRPWRLSPFPYTRMSLIQMLSDETK